MTNGKKRPPVAEIDRTYVFRMFEFTSRFMNYDIDYLNHKMFHVAQFVEKH